MNHLPFNKQEIESSISERFERVAARFATRTAIKSENVEWKYSELNAFSNLVAKTILTEFGLHQQPIVLIFNHVPAIFPAILGVLKSANFYIALDPEYPSSRSMHILDDLKIKLIITDSQNLSLASSFAQKSYSVLNIDQLIHQHLEENPITQPILPQSLQAVFFTSGSTGQPKGVERSHEYILHRIWMESNDYHIQPEDKFSLIHQCSFGASQTDIFNALLNGAQLCLFDTRMMGFEMLIPWLKNEGITFFHVPADLFRRFIDLLSQEDFFPQLRQITPSGRLYKKDVEQIRKHIPSSCVLIQRLASTESGMITRLIIDQEIDLRDNVLPVGYAVADTEVLILDEAGMQLDFNHLGEIAVKSAYLASGYWKRPDLTKAAFQSVPGESKRRLYKLGDLGRMRPDGCVELIGRKDLRQKIRGFRVELGEIEATLLNLSEIKEAVVLSKERGGDEKRLIAYVVPADNWQFSTRYLRSALLEKLPEYMIPSVFIPLTELPLTERNKVAFDSLPDPGMERPYLDEAYTAPRNSTEITLSNIWSETLYVFPVGIHDNFFELGGHSLHAAQIISRANTVFNTRLPLRALFDTPTISELAALVKLGKKDDLNKEGHSLQEALRMLGY